MMLGGHVLLLLGPDKGLLCAPWGPLVGLAPGDCCPQSHPVQAAAAAVAGRHEIKRQR